MVENKVSVIVPIYKVETFITKCVRSLMTQTLEEVEYIFVDDASPDNSIQLLEKCIQQFPSRLNRIRILHHKENQGLPAARNTGLLKATGEYVFHCDSDDFVEPDMLETLYILAKKLNADYIWCDWFLSYQNSERYMKQPHFNNSMDALRGMLSDAMKYNVWNKLVRRALYVQNNIQFPSGHSMGEDMTMIRLMACANTVAYAPQAFYHYVKTNSGAMTQSFNERYLADLRYNVDITINSLQQRMGDSLQKELAFFKLNVKLPFLITLDWKSYRRWNEWYPESNDYIMKNTSLPLRTRSLQVMAVWKLYVFVWVYNILVYKILYKLLY